MAAGGAPTRVLVLGLGYSGRRVAALLRARGVACSGTVREPDAAPDDGVVRHCLVAGQPIDDALREAIRSAEAVICTVPPDEGGDPALRLVAAELQESPALGWVGYLSSTAVYADREGGWIDETSVADAVDDTARRRLLAEAQWREFARGKGVASAVFRLPGIYGRGRNALVQLAEGRARHVVRPGLKFNRLHVEDLAAVVVAAMDRPGEALYLPADDEPAAPQDVLAFAAKLGGFAMPPAVAWDDPSVGPALRRFYASNKRIDSRGTREALGWKPTFATYREGLQDAIRQGWFPNNRR
ncbi:epimerase [Stenotrophomonas sp. 22385]|uniref:epimerase n=1 Tax=Stenotrophomonas sp. 22385 TaxID=3453915 RepID=UPI003F849302